MCLAVDAREEHVLLRAVPIVLFRTHFHVVVGFVGGSLHLLGILHATLVDQRLHSTIAPHSVNHATVERAAVEQRSLAILLAAQILGQREGVVGRVLIERRVGVAADENERITRETDENHQNREGNVAQNAHGQLLAAEEQVPHQPSQHSQIDQYAFPSLTDEQHTAQQYGQHERDFHSQLAAAGVEFVDVPCQHGHEQNGVDEHAHVE